MLTIMLNYSYKCNNLYYSYNCNYTISSFTLLSRREVYTSDLSLSNMSSLSGGFFYSYNHLQDDKLLLIINFRLCTTFY